MGAFLNWRDFVRADGAFHTWDDWEILIGLLAQVKVAARAMRQFAADAPVSGGHEKYCDEAKAHAKKKRRVKKEEVKEEPSASDGRAARVEPKQAAASQSKKNQVGAPQLSKTDDGEPGLPREPRMYGDPGLPRALCIVLLLFPL